jgi:hypothetical protein
VRALALLLVSAGCNTPYLAWTPREPLAARRGRVAIAVEDRRERPGELGVAYGFGGVPEIVRVDATEPRMRLARLAMEALYTSGLSPRDPAGIPTARLALALDELRCDGRHFRAHATIVLSWTVLAPDGTQRTAPVKLTLSGKGHGCGDAFHDVLDQVLDELAAALVEGPAHDAAIGPADPV